MLKYHVIWRGRTARECSTTTMSCVDRGHWDNFYFVTLYVVDWCLRRIVHEIDVPIDEEGGWPPDDAFEKIGILLDDLEKLLQKHAHALEDGTVTWKSIRL